MKKRIIRLTPTGLLSVLCMLLYFNTSAQIYLHDFGTTPITSYPYTATPTVVDPDITNSSWTNNIGIWTGFTGETGMGLGHANASGSSTITLTFDVAAGKQLDITSFNFWRSRSNVAAQNWAMTINGITVGSGTIPTVGATIGLTPVANPITELTGTVTVVITLSNSFSSGGFFTLDNFELNGTITEPCTPPVITEIAPTSGPAETTVTITGSGFEAGAGTTAVHFNGVESSGFVVISDTEIKAIVPANATTGAITVFTDNCEALTSIYTFLESDCPDIGSSSEIYISELYDANSGTPGAIELYNPTSSAIDLNGYTLLRYGDIGDASPSYNMSLTGSIPANDTFIVAISISSICPGIPTDFPLTNGINGNDEFELLKNGAIIDNVQAPFNKGYTLIRNPDAVAPKINYNSADWLINETESCSNLDMHTAIIASTIATQPISEGICESDNISFTVAVSNDSGFTYQWKTIDETGNWVNVVDNAQFSGATTNTLTITSADIDLDITQYYCEIESTTCTLISNAVQLTVSPLPVAIIIETQPTCTEPTGSIEVTPVIGDDLTYSLDGIDYQTANTFNNLASGNYTVYVQSSAGCISTIPAVINPVPNAPDVATTTITQSTCTTSTGTIEVTAPIGMGLEYSINGVDFQTGTTFIVAPGTYNVTVINISSCTSITEDIIVNPAPNAPAVAATTITQPTCTESNGTIEITAPTGTGIEYSINGVDFQTNTTFTAASGTYNITVMNADGCTSITEDIIVNPAPNAPAIAATTITQPTCTESNGTIEITVPTGTGIEYSINGVDFQIEPTFTVTSGTYNVTVINADGCTSITEDIIINPAPNAPAVAATTITQPTCTEPNGTIEVTAPIADVLFYSINGVDFQIETTFTVVASGTYNVTVMNADGCTSITSDIVINPAPTTPDVATVDVTHPTCDTPTGIIEILTPAGMQYSIDGVNFQTTTMFSVTSGTYNVTVMNDDGCTSITGDIVINNVVGAPLVATATITQPTCDTATGTIEITAPTDAGLEYSIDGINFQTTTMFSVTSGTYNVTVMNADGCTSITGDIVINNAPDIPTIATINVTQPTCVSNTGTIEVTAPTATGLEYSIDGVNFQTTTTFNVASGTYNVTVMNAEGCTSVTNDIIINNAPDAPAVTGTQGCITTTFGQKYILEVQALDNSFDINTASYEWKDDNNTEVGNNENTFDVTQYIETNGIDSNDYPLNFTLTITTAGGCTAEYTFTVIGTLCDIPRGISPNNDGMNDKFDLSGLNARKVIIFNRYGKEVYSRNNYINEWEGQTDNGDELPTGTYFYMIETSNDSKTGWVYINRQEN